MFGLPNFHPILVHFSVGLLSVATLLFVVIECLSDGEIRRQMLIVARWNLWIGSLISILTMITGLNAFTTVNHSAVSHQAMLVHKAWAQPVAWLFLCLAIGQSFTYRYKALRLLLLIGLIASWFVLLIASYHGGKLVYTYGVGVQTQQASTIINDSDKANQPNADASKSGVSNVKIDQDNHNHDHDHDHDHDH